MTTAKDKASMKRYVEYALADYLAGTKSQRAMIGDIQSSTIRGKELAGMLESRRGTGDAAKYESLRRECETRGWLG